ncbi:MAG: hypothetical protein ABEJ86_01785 [Halococcoides sp.]
MPGIDAIDSKFLIAGLVPIVASVLIGGWALAGGDPVTALTVPVWALAGALVLAIGRREAAESTP